MAAFSFQRATAALPSFLKRRSANEAPRPPLRAVTDLGAPWAARMKAPAPAAAAPAVPPAAPRQESIVELLRRLERGLSERAEAKAADADGEVPATDRGEVDSALKTALDTLQRMARQPR